MSEDKHENPMTKEIIELAQRINRFAVRKGWSKGRLIRENSARQRADFPGHAGWTGATPTICQSNS